MSSTLSALNWESFVPGRLAAMAPLGRPAGFGGRLRHGVALAGCLSRHLLGGQSPPSDPVHHPRSSATCLGGGRGSGAGWTGTRRAYGCSLSRMRGPTRTRLNEPPRPAHHLRGGFARRPPTWRSPPAPRLQKHRIARRSPQHRHPAPPLRPTPSRQPPNGHISHPADPAHMGWAQHQRHRLHQIRRVQHRDSTITDQQVATTRRHPIHIPRHRQHHPGLIQRRRRSNQRPTPHRSLHHNHHRNQTRNDPVPRRETPTLRRSARRVFRDKRPATLDKRIGQRAMLSGICHIDATAQHTHPNAPHIDNTPMGGAVDAAGQPTDHAPPRPPCRSPIRTSHAEPVAGAPTSAHNRHPRPHRQPATDKEHIRSIGQHREMLRVPGVTPKHDPSSFSGDALTTLTPGHRDRRTHPRRHPQSPRSDRPHHRCSRPETLHQTHSAIRVETGKRQPQTHVSGHGAIRNANASATCASPTPSSPPRSAMDLATRRTRSQPRAVNANPTAADRNKASAAADDGNPSRPSRPRSRFNTPRSS